MVTPFFPPLVNGVSVYVSNLVRGLVEQGVNVHTQTLSYEWHRGTLNSSDSDLSVSRFKSSWLFGKDTLNQPISLQFIKSTIEKANDFDIVHVHDCPKFVNDAIILALKKLKPAKPLIFTPHGTGINSSTHLHMRASQEASETIDQKDTLNLLHNIFSNVYWSLGIPMSVLNAVDHIITVTPLQRDVYAQVCEERKISMISEAVPNYYFVDRPAFIEDDALKVLFIGRLLKEKGIKDLLYATRILTQKSVPVKLRCIGPDFGFMKEAQSIIKELDIADKVTLLGPLPEDQKLMNLGWCDVLVLPSYHEAFGIPIIEAMAHGKPVVATKTVGAMSLIADKETGFLVNLSDPEAIADRLAQFAKNSNLKYDMGIKALAFARSFSMKKMIKSHIELYQKVINQKTK
jgi:glycosyltransferase involved in cell wall biosynthesis